MKKFDLLKFDLNNEATAIVDYLEKYWEGANHDFLSAVVDHVLTSSFHQGAGWISRYGNEIVQDQLNMREEFLKLEDPDFFHFDEVLYSYIWGLWSNRGKYMDKLIGSWDYDAAVNNTIKELKTEFDPKILDNLKPKGYDEFLKDYDDYEGMEELDCNALEEEFEGIDASECRSHSLPVRLSLPHVAYDDTNQGRNPLRVLVGTIYSQGLGIHQEVNDTVLDQYIKSIDVSQPYSKDGTGLELPFLQLAKDIIDVERRLAAYPENAKFVLSSSASGTPQHMIDRLREQEQKQLATQLIKALAKQHNFVIHREYHDDVTEFGMKVLFVIIEDDRGVLGKLRFNPDNGKFDVHHISLGYIPFEDMLDR